MAEKFKRHVSGWIWCPSRARSRFHSYKPDHLLSNLGHAPREASLSDRRKDSRRKIFRTVANCLEAARLPEGSLPAPAVRRSNHVKS
jgi:hypothetical protein